MPSPCLVRVLGHSLSGLRPLCYNKQVPNKHTVSTMNTYPMDDQVTTISHIIDASKAGDLATTQQLVRQLNATAEERGLGKNYWLKFCQSMAEASRLAS